MGGTINLTGVPDFDQMEIVREGYSYVQSDGSTVNVTTVAHNLGYTPQIIAYLNRVGFSAGATIITSNGDIPIPTYLSSDLATLNVVKFKDWVHAIVDSTNIYFVLLNSTGSTYAQFPIKFTLLRKRSR